MSRREADCKPSPVPTSWTETGDGHPSRPTVARRLKRPTRKLPGSGHSFPIWSCTEWGLPCPACRHPGGALLPHPFSLTCACAPAVYFLLHFPSGRPALPLAGTPIHEVLGLSSPAPTKAERGGDHPSSSRQG